MRGVIKRILLTQTKSFNLTLLMKMITTIKYLTAATPHITIVKIIHKYRTHVATTP